MDKDRQVRYNSKRSKDNPECMEWFFLIINQNREIFDIENRIHNLFAPIEEDYLGFEGIVKGTGLRYKLIRILSRKKIEKSDLYNIYPNGRVLLDRKLYPREEFGGLENYLIDNYE